MAFEARVVNSLREHIEVELELARDAAADYAMAADCEEDENEQAELLAVAIRMEGACCALEAVLRIHDQWQMPRIPAHKLH